MKIGVIVVLSDTGTMAEIRDMFTRCKIGPEITECTVLLVQGQHGTKKNWIPVLFHYLGWGLSRRSYRAFE